MTERLHEEGSTIRFGQQTLALKFRENKHTAILDSNNPSPPFYVDVFLLTSLHFSSGSLPYSIRSLFSKGART